MTLYLGLTGSIAMGKSATAQMFSDSGVPVYDADAAVHGLYQRGGAAIAPVSALFPEALKDGAISRDILRTIVLSAPEKLDRLNKIVHPLVARTQQAFRAKCEAEQAHFAVLDIPLLFETGGERSCDYIAVVTASAALQRARVLSRPDMTEASFKAILDRQWPDARKRAAADFIISTGFGFRFTREHVAAIIALMQRIALEKTQNHDTNSGNSL